MIDTSRLGQMDNVLQHLAANAPAALSAFYKGCKQAAFDEAQAFELTRTVLASVLAIPSPSEQASKTNS